MRSDLVVIAGISLQDPAQVSLAQDDDALAGWLNCDSDDIARLPIDEDRSFVDDCAKLVTAAMSAPGPKQTSLVAPHMSAFRCKADISTLPAPEQSEACSVQLSYETAI